MDEYSMLARNAFLEHLPELVAEMREQPDGSLFLDKLSPSGYEFWISTDGNQVTVGFSWHHRHFGTPWEPVAAEDVCDANEYIRKLMDGQYQVAVWSKSGKFVQSETIERGMNPATVRRSWFGRWWLRGCSVEVHEW